MNNEEQFADVLARVEILFEHAGKELPSPDALEMFVDDAFQDALNFCNRNEMPWEANKTLARMAYLAATGLTIGTKKHLKSTPVASVSEEGRTVSFATAAQIQAAAQKSISDIETQLSRFKDLYAYR